MINRGRCWVTSELGGRKLAPMSAEREGKSHASTWTLAVLVVPLLYLLSAPPIVGYFCTESSGTLQLGGRPALFVAVSKPRWVRLYYAPYAWLQANTPLHRPLDAYMQWSWSRQQPSWR